MAEKFLNQVREQEERQPQLPSETPAMRMGRASGVLDPLCQKPVAAGSFPGCGCQGLQNGCKHALLFAHINKNFKCANLPQSSKVISAKTAEPQIPGSKLCNENIRRYVMLSFGLTWGLPRDSRRSANSVREEHSCIDPRAQEWAHRKRGADVTPNPTRQPAPYPTSSPSHVGCTLVSSLLVLPLSKLPR